MKHSYADLTQEQLTEIDWLKYRTESLFFQAIGFGKTVCVLTAVKEMREVYGPWKVLVIAPKKICDLTWGPEIENWDHLANEFTFASAAGRKMKAVLEEPDVLAVNYESMEWYYDLVDAGKAQQREILIFDESDNMKGAKSNRTARHTGHALKRNGKIYYSGGYVRKFKRRIAMTATPCPESYESFWAQEACVSTAQRLGHNISNFRQTFGTPKWNGFGHQYQFDSPDVRSRIEQTIAPIARLAPEVEYMDLPDPIESCIEVPWTREAREEYDVLAHDLEVSLAESTNEDLELSELDIAADGVAGKINKLRQLCSGFAYNRQGETVLTADPQAKLRALDTAMQRANGAPVLVFTQFIAEREMIVDYFPYAHAGLANTREVEAWNEGKYRMLVLHPRSAGAGLNLQYGGFIALYYSMPYSYRDWSQSWGRLHRRGQTRQVSLLRIERAASIEQAVTLTVRRKERRLSGFLRALRGLQAGYPVPG